MSSGESRTTSSSRISQFGLYRSIDARTEEFLRLSRKRQIRQGCACAAVSTAITVTVVVTVLLVYEYNVSTETNLDLKSNKKPNWISLFNESAPFDAKYNKAKLNLDPATIKLLPIILKALKNNRYLEKLIEDSSSSPVYERKDTTEFAFKKNVFSDSKNWIKNPGTKTYETDYKTSPIGYLKLPSSNLDYYRKIRKIRDYQRILNYFDKMISEKVSSGSTRHVHLETETEKPSKRALPKKNLKQADLITKEKKQLNTTVNDYTKTTVTKSKGCKCPKKLGLLLSKLLSNIQELIPEIMIAKSPCNEKNDYNNIRKDNTIRTPTLKTLGTTKSKIFNTIAKSTIATKKNSKTSIKHIRSSNEGKKNIVPQQTFDQNSSDIEDDSLELDFMRKFYKKYIIPATTTSKGYLEATKALCTNEEATKPMQKNTQTIIRNQISADKDDIAEEYTTEYYDIQKLMTTPNYKDEYNNYDTTTNDEYDNNKLNEIRLPGLKLNSEKYHKITKNKPKPIKTKLNFLPFTNSAIGPHLFDFNKISITTIPSSPKRKETTVTTQSTTATSPSTTDSYIEYESSTTARNYSEEDITTKRSKYITSLPSQNISTAEKNDDIEENRPDEDDIQEEESMQQIDTLNKSIRPGFKWYDKYKKENYSSLQYGPVTIKTTDSSNFLLRFEEIKPRQLKSMLPESRPIYLEINQHDSKQDTADDYNANLKDQNIFDLY